MENTFVTLCLNMIVKNESLIIERMLDSVIDIIDSYCICDTGSTDNTVDLIKKYFAKKNINGKIIYEPFINFEHNRNYAIHQCYKMADYILLMDADMILVNNGFDKKTLTLYDSHCILQKKENIQYVNVRIIKNTGLCKYIGVTHEFIELPNEITSNFISEKFLYINDLNDGRCKDNKYERDIDLLSTSLINEPNNSRYVFYLAISYYSTKQYKLCIEKCLTRISMGGEWEQEIWFSYYMTGISYMSLNECDKGIYYQLEAYNYFPKRIENLFEIIKYYVQNEKYNIAKLYYDIAKNIVDKMTENEKYTYLFFINKIYDYHLHNNFILFAYKTNQPYPFKDINDIINKLHDNCTIIDSFYSNVEHYIYKLEHINIEKLTKNIDVKERYNIVKLYPTINYCVSDNNIISLTEKMPKIFEYVRKYSNMCVYKNNIYFILSTKLIINEKNTIEHNIIAIFNKNMNLLKYTIPFRIENVVMNQCSEIVVNDSEIILSYATNSVKINNLDFENMLI